MSTNRSLGNAEPENIIECTYGERSVKVACPKSIQLARKSALSLTRAESPCFTHTTSNYPLRSVSKLDAVPLHGSDSQVLARGSLEPLGPSSRPMFRHGIPCERGFLSPACCRKYPDKGPVLAVLRLLSDLGNRLRPFIQLSDLLLLLLHLGKTALKYFRTINHSLS